MRLANSKFYLLQGDNRVWGFGGGCSNQRLGGPEAGAMTEMKLVSSAVPLQGSRRNNMSLGSSLMDLRRTV